ncbi:unnamed protein product, partial [Closterium sp. NIES-53]
LQPASPLPGRSPYSGPTRGITERCEPESCPASPESRPASPESRPESLVRVVRTGRRVLRQRPPPVPGTYSMTLHPSTAPHRVPLPTGHSLSAPPSDESEDMDAAKRVLRYLSNTSGMGLVLGGRARVFLTGHADASWIDDLAMQRSSKGYTFSLGSSSVSWRSTCLSSVLSSSCEAEIYAGAMAAQELRWLTNLLADLEEAPRSPSVLYVDNKAMLALCQEHKLEHRTKHIALRYFLARELQQRGQLRLAYVAT